MVDGSEPRLGTGARPWWGFPLALGVLTAAGSYWFLSSREAEPVATPRPALTQGSSFLSAPPVEATTAVQPVPEKPVGSISGTPVEVAPPAKQTPAPVPVAVLEPANTGTGNSGKASEVEKLPGNPPDPAPTPKAEAKVSEAKPDPNDGKTLMIPFAKLSFRYWPQIKGGRDPFPAEVRKLDGRKVIIEGFMVPVDFDKGKIQTFLLTRSMIGCCYADSPGITDIIKVQRADGKPAQFTQMARVTGTLEVGEEKDSEGYIESVYRIKADDIAPAMFGR